MTMTLVLVFKAREARTKDHRRTEMWLYLPKDRRPPQAYRTADDRKPSCGRRICCSRAGPAIISIVMWTLALFFSAIGL